MATYVLPQVLVFQEFALVPAVDILALPAFICGGHAHLVRCDVADEKPDGLLGMYDHVGTSIDGDLKTCYSWPTKPVGSVIDEDYTKLCIDDALLRYFYTNSTDVIRTDVNKVRHSTKNFKTNPDSPLTYPRHADFLDRDVAVGDTVRITGYDDDNSVSVDLCTYVKAIEADEVASEIDAAAVGASNAATQSADSEQIPNSGNSGDATISGTEESAYDGLADGDINETYTITVTQASTGGDATTAVLQVVSASGNDDDLEATPAAFDAPTAVGARGGTATWTGSNFTVGDEWTVIMTQVYTVVAATKAGTYTGTTDRTYIIECTLGGTYAGTDPEITVTTADGTDFSGPTTVTATDTNVAVGTYGVLVQFNQLTLNKGERFTIAATAAKDGNFKTLVLGHALADGIYTDTSGLHFDEDAVVEIGSVAPQLEIALYIKKDLEVGEQHVDIGGQYNWEQSDTEFCAFAGIQAFDDSWTDSGVLVALDVIKDAACANTNQMHIHYRAWESSINTVETISDVADLGDISGALHPDNELKFAVAKALANSNGQDVKYLAVPDPSATADWIDVLEAIEERTDVYGLVPLTRTKAVLDLFAAHVDAQSTETAGRWRVLWTNLDNDPVLLLADATTTDDTEVIRATTEDDPDTSGLQYTILRVTSGNIELLAAAGLRAGDTVRYIYTEDLWGTETYDEYVVDAVLSEDSVRLVTGTNDPEPTPLKVEFHRTLNLTEQAAAIAADSGNWANRRVLSVWPDTVGNGGTTFKGYHLCAGLAGLVSGVVPHQGLTRLELAGFDDLTRTTELFSRTQLDVMAVNGTWVVTADPQSNEIFTRHAVTTADYETIAEREEMITRNVDSISYYFLGVFDPYIGISNVTPSMLAIIEAETKAGIQFLRESNYTDRLGGQLIDASITELRASPVFKDRIILGLDLDLPFPLNNLEIHLLV